MHKPCHVENPLFINGLRTHLVDGWNERVRISDGIAGIPQDYE
jgi:hypothetical protein